MIGSREDGFQPLRYKLGTLSGRELIHFGWELRKKCFKPKEDRCWKELELARGEEEGRAKDRCREPERGRDTLREIEGRGLA